MYMRKSELKALISESIQEVVTEIQNADSKRSELKKVISEVIEEIKLEEFDGIGEIVDALSKEVKSKYKEANVMFDDSKNITIDCGQPHRFSIRPKSMNIFDVLYIKDGTDRDKKLNLNIDELKTYINDKLKSKDLNYVKKAFNKSADDDKDKVEKSTNPRNDILTKKEVKDAKNDEKNYNEPMVKNEDDLPTKPMRDATKFKKQNENPVKGTKPDYTYPKQKDKKITIIRKKTTKFKR